MYKIKNNRRNKRKVPKKLLVVVLAALLIAGAVFAFYRYQDQNKATPTDQKETVASNVQEEETPTSPTKTPTTTTTKSTRDGGAIDNNGEGVSATDQAIKSASGRITVYSPTTNSVVRSGGTLTGASSLSSVNYRLIDDQVGVIGSGVLKVVNGKFSGTFSFNSAGKEGRLDVFRMLDDGREVDTVEIPVRYQ